MKYFGTDGIRGKFGEKITPNLAYKVGLALANFFGTKSKVVLGTDTRLSNGLLLSAITVGLIDGGVNVTQVQIATSPCVAYLTKNCGFDFGIMITASHNPPEYNGFKIFNSEGEKVETDIQQKIENLIDSLDLKKADLFNLGKLTNKKLLVNKYVNNLAKKFEHVNNLPFKICIDCANGASSDIVKKVVKKLNLNATIINKSDKGAVINVNAGATCLKPLQNYVEGKGFDIAFSFDGDADRIMIVDNLGYIRDGDDILFALSKVQFNKKDLKRQIVTTEYSNCGLDVALKKQNVKVVRVNNSDACVYKKLKEAHLNLGGEKAGHIIFKEHVASGDGVYTMLKILSLIKEVNKPLSLILSELKKFPQVEVNVPVSAEKKREIINDIKFKKLMFTCDELLMRDGRILVRPSGTENVVRILVECNNEVKAQNIASILSEHIKENF